MTMKKLPVGIDSFEKLRKEDFYYVDKTGLIADLMANWGEVNLFTRPRRFGKTLNMSMLKCFFEIGSDKSIFDGLTISREKDDAHWAEGNVYSGMPAGSETLVSVRVGSATLTVKELGSTHYASDEKVYLGFNPDKINVFDAATENLIKYCV